jgi:NAD(P)-dependent dehydrogenase (short-subunit alcohol dehydrogenase family)
MPRAGRAHYAASKAEVVMLMKTIAFDLDYTNGTTIYTSHGHKALP